MVIMGLATVTPFILAEPLPGIPGLLNWNHIDIFSYEQRKNSGLKYTFKQLSQFLIFYSKAICSWKYECLHCWNGKSLDWYELTIDKFGTHATFIWNNFTPNICTLYSPAFPPWSKYLAVNRSNPLWANARCQARERIIATLPIRQ